MKSALMVAVCTLMFAQSSFAQGTQGSGGGTGIKLANDMIVVADDYIDVNQPTEMIPVGASVVTFSPELREELRRINVLLSAYTNGRLLRWDNYRGFDPQIVQDALKDIRNPFFDDQVFSDKIKYLLVDEIPDYCSYQIPQYLNSPAGSKGEPVLGCTAGAYTYLIKSQWTSEHFSVREKARLITHERLRAVLGFGPVADVAIAKINQGLGVLLEQYNLELAGEFRTLSTEQVTKIEKMREAFVSALGDFFKNYWMHDYDFGLNTAFKKRDVVAYEPTIKGQVVANGGGLVSEGSQIDSSAYVGAGVVLSTWIDRSGWQLHLAGDRSDGKMDRDVDFITAKIAKNAKVLGLGMVCAGCSVQENSVLDHVYSVGTPDFLYTAGHVEVAANSTIEKLGFVPTIKMNWNEAYLDTPRIEVGNNVHVSNVEVEQVAPGNTYFSTRRIRSLVFEDGVSIRGLDLKTKNRRVVGKSSMLPLTLTIFPAVVALAFEWRTLEEVTFPKGFSFDAEADDCTERLKLTKAFGKHITVKKRKLLKQCR